MQNEEAIILRVCRQARRMALKKLGTVDGYCIDISNFINSNLIKYNIETKLVYGVFRLDYDLHNGKKIPYIPSHDDAHTWVEWKGIPIDASADQFNTHLTTKNKVKAIVFGTNLDRFLDWDFDPIYK